MRILVLIITTFAVINVVCCLLTIASFIANVLAITIAVLYAMILSRSNFYTKNPFK